MFKSIKHSFNNKRFIMYTFAIILSTLTLVGALFFNMHNVSALDTSKLKLSAEVDVNNVLDGTPDFDADNNPGNDSSAQNGIVRSNDVVTTPLKLVVNTTDGSLMKNIKLKVEAIIEDNKIGNTSKATFDQPTKTTMDNNTKTVTFTDIYTMSSTGQAVSFPITALANGVDNGTKFKMKYRVTVLDENNQPTSVVKEFTYNREFTISSKVNIGVEMHLSPTNQGVRSEGLIISDFPGKDLANTTVSLTAGVFARPLAGRTNLKGSAAPTGDITYTMTKGGRVSWDNEGSVPLDLNSTDKNAKLIIGDGGGFYYSSAYSYQKQRELGIDVVDGSQGFYVKNGVTNWGYITDAPGWVFESNGNYMPYSGVNPDNNQNQVTAQYVHNVLGSSGHWSVDYDNMTNTSFSGVISGYSNAGYPQGSAAAYAVTGDHTDLKRKNYNVFSVGNFLFRDVNEYAHNHALNPNNKDNTLISSYTMRVTSYKDATGNTYPIDASYTKELSHRNLGPGQYIVSGHWHDRTTGYAFNHRWNGDGSWNQFGDGIAPNDSSDKTMIVVSVRTALESPFLDGVRYVIKWNPAFASIDRDAKSNQSWRANAEISSGYTISKTGSKTYGGQKDYSYTFGVLKDQSKVRDFAYVRAAKYDEDYNWFANYDEAKRAGQVSAIMVAFDAKLINSNYMYTPYMTIHDDNYYTNKQPDGSWNFATWDIYGYNGKFGDKASEIHVDADYSFGNFAEWDSINQVVTNQQTPSLQKVDFDSLAVSGAKYTNTYYVWSNTDSNTRSFTAIHNNVIKSNELAWFGADTLRAYIEPGVTDRTLYEQFKLPPSATFVKAVLYDEGKNRYTDITPESMVTQSDGSQVVKFKLPDVTSNTSLEMHPPHVYIQFKLNEKVATYDSSGKASIDIYGNTYSDLDPMAKDWLTTPSSYKAGRVPDQENTNRILVQRVSRVGVNQSISSIKSERDSQFRIITEPYTTQSFDENGVKGLIRLAQNGSNGSSFSGSYKVNVGYQAAGKTINFWYTNEDLASFDPHNVDKTKFTPVTANSPALFTAKYIYYEIVEPIRNTDDVKIYTNVFPTGNKANDVYSFQSSLNSSTRYETPVLSEINTHSVVEHTISGTLWLDTNEDHLLDSGDDRLANERVTLTNTVTGESISTTTNANGEYSFAHVLGSKQIANNAWFDNSSLTDTNYVYKITHSKRANWLLAQKNKGLQAVSSKADLVNGVSTIDGLDLADYSTFTGIDAVTQQNIGYLLMVKHMDISKNWSMNGATATSHSPITVTIKQNGTNFKTVTLSASNNWTISDKLPSIDANGNAYTYSAVETNTPNGYASSVNVSDNAIDVTNTWKNEQTTVAINKNWVGFEKNKTKPSAKFHILADGKVVKDVTLTAGSNWSAVGSYQLPKYGTDGHTIDYTIQEYDVPPIVVDVAASEPSTNTFHVTNTRLSLQTLPNTGSGKIILLIGAVTIIFGAAITITIKQKRK